MTDTQVIPYADRLLDCLCAALADSLGGPVCRCCLRPGGGLPPMDSCYCECGATGGGNGQASVQVSDYYPSARFPRRGIDVWDDNCNTITWVAELTMTVYRCVHVLAEDGTPPTCAELDADARKLASDRTAMMAAWACCDWRRAEPGGEEASVVPQGWTPVGPLGGCAGGTFTVLVDVGPFCCPQPLP